jgi:hypothetical protein
MNAGSDASNGIMMRNNGGNSSETKRFAIGNFSDAEHNKFDSTALQI